MSNQLEVQIGNKPYRLSVEPGQEVRLKAVAARFNEIVEKMLANAGMDRDQVLVMAGIVLADEYQTLVEEQEITQQTIDRFHQTLAERLESVIAK